MIKLKKKEEGKSWACVFSDWEISKNSSSNISPVYRKTTFQNLRVSKKKPISQGRHSSKKKKKDPLHSRELNIPSERARTTFFPHTLFSGVGRTGVTKRRPSTEPLSSLTMNRPSSSSSMWELVKIKRSCREATAAR